MSSNHRGQAIDASVPVTILSLMPSLHYGGLSVARTLGRWGVPIHWIHPHDSHVALASRYLVDVFPILQNLSTEAIVNLLLDYADRIGQTSILIPVDDRAATVVADNAATLRQSFLFPEQHPDLARSLGDKMRLHDLCIAHGIPTPSSTLPVSRAALEEYLGKAAFPVVVKRIANWEHDGVERESVTIASDATMVRLLFRDVDWTKPPNALLQEYVPGLPDTVWMFDGYFSSSSECLMGITARKLRQAPPYTGVTTLGICEHNAELAATTIEFLGHLGYVGIVDLGYRWDERDGQYKLLDVNPRIGATFRLFADSHDLDVARAMYLDLTSQPIIPGDPQPGRKWLLEPNDLMSSLRYARDGGLSFAGWWKSLRGVDETAWFARDDLRPFAAMVWDSLKRSGPKLLELR